MNVSSPALPVAPAPAASTSPRANGGTDSAAPENFASLLSDNSGKNPGNTKSDDSGSGLGQNTAAQNTGTEEETTDAVPTPAEQITLAALLYAPQLTPAPTPTPLGDSVGVANPSEGEASEGFSPSSQNLPLLQSALGAEEVSSNPVLANLELPTTPIAPGGFQVPQAPAPAADPSTPLADPSVAAGLPPAAVTTAPETATGTVTAPATTTPDVTTAEVPTEAGADRPLDPAVAMREPAFQSALPTGANEAPATALPAAEITSANSAATPADTTISANLPKSQSAANTDGRLASEQPIAQQTPRGTSSAKAVREMKSPTATTADSSPESTQRSVTLDKGAQGETSGDQQDSSSSENSAAPQTGTGTFSVSTAAHAAKSEATSKAAPAAPMTPAAIVKEVNQGLERIQQSGHDRMDLRLSLEGGGEVSIALQVRDGAVHASFQTNSPEMREALQKNWVQMAARSENLAIPLAEPTFKSSTNNPGNSFQQQDPRERQQEASQQQGQGNPRAAFYENGSAQPAKRVTPTVTPVRRASSGLNLYA